MNYECSACGFPALWSTVEPTSALPRNVAAASRRRMSAMGPRLDRRASPILAAGVLALALSGAVPGRAAAQGNPFGMDIHSPTGKDLTVVMDRLQAAGIGWAPLSGFSPSVQGTPGHCPSSVSDPIA